MHSTVESRAWIVFAGLLVAAAAGLAFYLGVGRGDLTYELRTSEPVSGLLAGAPVEFHGVEVGQVHEVRLLDPRTVQVLLRMRRDAPVSTATVATITGRGIASRGFTGYVYVSLEDVSTTGTALAATPGESYRRIATAPARSVSLDTSMTQLNDSMQSVMGLLRETLDTRTVGALKATVDHLEQVSGSLASNDAKLRAIIANTERASGKLGPLLQSGGQAMGTLQNRVLPQAQDTLARFDAVAGSASSTLRHVEDAGSGLVPLVQSGNRVMQSVETQVLPQAMQSLRRTNEVLIKLDDTAERVRENPSTLVWGPRTARASPGESH